MAKNKKQELLKALKQKMLKDKNLPLRGGATNLVFGEGNSNAAFLFIGEGPGYWEDVKGRPFVGNAGAFLNQLINIMGKERNDVFITNVVHFRPPENRDPEPDEMKAFKPYLDRMIEIIDPAVIITLGRFSMAKFLPGTRISSVHGKPHIVNWKDNRIIVVPMYHPAAGLRNGNIKRQTIEDFRKIPEILKEMKEQEVAEKEINTEQMSLV
jgi:DNA polymerase